MTERLFLSTREFPAERLASLGGLQIKMLSHAMNAFYDAKKIIYSTCSIFPEENEHVVHRCLEMCPNWELIKPLEFAETWKHFGSKKFKHVGKKCIYAKSDIDLTDGFFVAIFQRKQIENVDEHQIKENDSDAVVLEGNNNGNVEDVQVKRKKKNKERHKEEESLTEEIKTKKENDSNAVVLEGNSNGHVDDTQVKKKKKKKKEHEENEFLNEVKPKNLIDSNVVVSERSNGQEDDTHVKKKKKKKDRQEEDEFLNEEIKTKKKRKC